ncbi:MAG: OsmC family protein [Candidatus Phytoplasma australasiaticum]|nr:OsmC family protein [Candidatus Phytoplasma australasiaticum]MDV3199913.1 OsmC family protein [Candidatus Phytoplasma australasiaticum]
MKNQIEIIAYYEPKLQDIGFIHKGLKTKLTSTFANSSEISNPKELFCLSLLICFYKTTRKYLNHSDFKIKILCNSCNDDKGFYFDINLVCGIKNLSLIEIQDIMNLVHQKCPISRMLNNYQYFKIKPILYKDF